MGLTLNYRSEFLVRASPRVFARRERPRPGAQLSLLEAGDGWRYSLWITNLPVTFRGWRANAAYIDAAHRVHARVEDGIRTGKDCPHSVARRPLDGGRATLTIRVNLAT